MKLINLHSRSLMHELIPVTHIGHHLQINSFKTNNTPPLKSSVTVAYENGIPGNRFHGFLWTCLQTSNMRCCNLQTLYLPLRYTTVDDLCMYYSKAKVKKS